MRRLTHARAAALGVFLAVIAALPVAANGVTVAKHSNPVPDEIAAPVKAALAPGGATVTIPGNTLEFWWVTALAGAGKDWSGVAEGALVGAMKVSAVFKDIRGRNIKPGTYLLRFALQPQNGDHLGVSPHRQFLIATPAADDTKPEALGHEPAVELGAKTTNIAHPAIISIDPPVASEAPLSVTQNDEGHTAVVFQVPAANGVKFGLVVVGHIEA